jgi:hypothetical protein
MARIRTVKPELFRHEELYDLELSTGLPIRLAWIGLFTVADREGRFKWRSRALKTEILPFDDVDFEHVLLALEAYGMVVRYRSDEEEFGVIVSFKKHQCVNQREAQSTLPAPPEEILSAKPSRRIPSHIKRPVHARADTCAAYESTYTTPVPSQPEPPKPESKEPPLSTVPPESSNIKGADADTETHVQARGEGKGREQEWNGKERKGASLTRDELALAAQAPLPKVLNSLSGKAQISGVGEVIATYCEGWKERYKSPRSPDITGKNAGLLKGLVNDLGRDRVLKLIEAYLSMPDGWFITKRHDIPTFHASLNSVALFADSGKMISKTETRQIDQAISTQNTIIALRAGEI